jgi:hypothetical protein
VHFPLAYQTASLGVARFADIHCQLLQQRSAWCHVVWCMQASGKQLDADHVAPLAWLQRLQHQAAMLTFAEKDGLRNHQEFAAQMAALKKKVVRTGLYALYVCELSCPVECNVSFGECVSAPSCAIESVVMCSIKQSQGLREAQQQLNQEDVLNISMLQHQATAGGHGPESSLPPDAVERLLRPSAALLTWNLSTMRAFRTTGCAAPQHFIMRISTYKICKHCVWRQTRALAGRCSWCSMGPQREAMRQAAWLWDICGCTSMRARRRARCPSQL